MDKKEFRNLVKTANETGDIAALKERSVTDSDIIDNIRQENLSGKFVIACANRGITGTTLGFFAAPKSPTTIGGTDRFQEQATETAEAIEKNPDLLNKDSAHAVVRLACFSKNDELCKSLERHGKNTIEDKHFNGLDPRYISGKVVEACANSQITGKTLAKYAGHDYYAKNNLHMGGNNYVKSSNYREKAFYAEKADTVIRILNKKPDLCDEDSVESVRTLAQRAESDVLGHTVDRWDARRHRDTSETEKLVVADDVGILSAPDPE